LACCGQYIGGQSTASVRVLPFARRYTSPRARIRPVAGHGRMMIV
jgi:hypothetical protein